jgi:hypothetical protein
MYKWKACWRIFLALILWSWLACARSGGSSNTYAAGNLNSVESQIAGTWSLVSKIDSVVLPGNILSTTAYSNFTYGPAIVFGTLLANGNVNPVAKSFTYKGVNIGPAFTGPPDSTLHGNGTWYYDLGNKSIYLNFGRYGFSMSNDSMTISVAGDVSPMLTNTWLFTKQ